LETTPWIRCLIGVATVRVKRTHISGNAANRALCASRSKFGLQMRQPNGRNRAARVSKTRKAQGANAQITMCFVKNEQRGLPANRRAKPRPYALAAYSTRCAPESAFEGFLRLSRLFLSLARPPLPLWLLVIDYIDVLPGVHSIALLRLLRSTCSHAANPTR